MATLKRSAVSLFFLVLLVAVAVFDNRTGAEISVFPLYAVPITLAAWGFGGMGAAAAATLASVAWFLANRSIPYSADWVLYSNGVTRAIFFFTAATLAHRLLKDRTAAVARRNPPPTQLDVCNGCQRIRDDREDYWCPLEDYLTENLGPIPRRKLCPSCAREVAAKVIIPTDAIDDGESRS